MFDPTVTVVTIFAATNFLIQIVVLYVGWSLFRARVDLLLAQQEKVIVALTSTQHDHEKQDDRRFDEFATRLTDLIRLVERLVGENVGRGNPARDLEALREAMGKGQAATDQAINLFISGLRGELRLNTDRQTDHAARIAKLEWIDQMKGGFK